MNASPLNYSQSICTKLRSKGVAPGSLPMLDVPLTNVLKSGFATQGKLRCEFETSDRPSADCLCCEGLIPTLALDRF